MNLCYKIDKENLLLLRKDRLGRTNRGIIIKPFYNNIGYCGYRLIRCFVIIQDPFYFRGQEFSRKNKGKKFIG